QKGVLNLAKNSAHTLGNSGQDVMENILRFGLEKDADPAYLQAIRPVFYAFWQEIAFTLSSFTAQSEHHQVINHVLLLGGGAGIKGITSFASQQLGVPCDIFQSAKLVAKEDTSITSKNGFSNLYTMSLSTALAAHTLPLFNLRKKEFARTQDQGLFGKQILTALVLTALLLISLGINSFWQLYTIRSQAQEAEQETVQLLKAQFKIPETDENLEDVVQLATNEVKREQKLWFSFANPGRTPFLAYLLELTNKVDKEDLGFSIDTLRITDTTMIMAAHVKDHAALARLEQELQKSKLFKIAEPKPQTTDFEMKLKLS
ncbi:MAG TPA: hypothetical protein VLG71_02030, partial [Candidatus Limnocylindria bacterium]|nr:hypothetical protein [Candidatus Limnocylindria bacterium]